MLLPVSGDPIVRAVRGLRSSGLEEQGHERGQQTPQVVQEGRKFALHSIGADFLKKIFVIILCNTNVINDFLAH